MSSVLCQSDGLTHLSERQSAFHELFVPLPDKTNCVPLFCPPVCQSVAPTLLHSSAALRCASPASRLCASPASSSVVRRPAPPRGRRRVAAKPRWATRRDKPRSVRLSVCPPVRLSVRLFDCLSVESL
eukprot:Selendium_serpulae@DN331_c0_g1_i1.p2